MRLRFLPFLCALISHGLVSCASFDHPLTRHDMDGDGAISHSEYQQSRMQYSVARHQRVDEYDRARQFTRHIHNVGDFIGGLDRSVRLIQHLGN